MNKPTVKDKIISLEADIRLLKKAVTPQPNFDIDEKNWKLVESAVKKSRAKVYKKTYGSK